MKALEYRPTIARYAANRIAKRARRGGAIVTDRLPARDAARRNVAGLSLVELRPPPLPGPDWVPIRPRLSGICGSDMALLDGHASLYLASLTSTPFVPGHEVVGEVAAGELRGRRVVIEPALGCTARGVDPPCEECSADRHALCTAVTAGSVSAGLQIGFCRQTGGGWSESFVAHRSQLHLVPGSLSDEDAVLVEPLACALHAVRRAQLASDATVVVIGAGTIGLMTIAAVRELVPRATVLAVVKHKGQELPARRLGADVVCRPADLHLQGVQLTGARRLVGHGGRELLLGGFDAMLDCVGSGASLESAVTAVRPRGTVVLVGMPGRVTADLVLAWQREVTILGAYGYAADFGDALALAARLSLGDLVARGWPLSDYRRALDESRRATRAGKVKTVFDLRDEQ